MLFYVPQELIPDRTDTGAYAVDQVTSMEVDAQFWNMRPEEAMMAWMESEIQTADVHCVTPVDLNEAMPNQDDTESEDDDEPFEVKWYPHVVDCVPGLTDIEEHATPNPFGVLDGNFC